MMKLNNIFNKIFNRKNKENKNEKYYKIKCNMNGTGSLSVDSIHLNS